MRLFVAFQTYREPIQSITFEMNGMPPIPITTPQKNEQMSKISPKAGTISTVVRSYKSIVSTNIHKMHADFAWQTRFHDHIIRDHESFERIQDYITNNPTNWKEDKFYS